MTLNLLIVTQTYLRASPHKDIRQILIPACFHQLCLHNTNLLWKLQVISFLEYLSCTLLKNKLHLGAIRKKTKIPSEHLKLSSLPCSTASMVSYVYKVVFLWKTIKRRVNQFVQQQQQQQLGKKTHQFLHLCYEKRKSAAGSKLLLFLVSLLKDW